MGSTPHFGFPIPDLATTPPDLPDAMGNLAQAIEDAFQIRSFKAFALDTLQTRSSASGGSAFDYLGTPDRVNVDVEANGLLLIAYRALWWAGGAGIGSHAGNAQLLVGTDPVRKPTVNSPADPYTPEITDDNKWSILTSSPGLGLDSYNSTTTDSAFAAGPQVVGFSQGLTSHGGFAVVENIAAGNHDVGVQFKIDSGVVSVKNRRLWVASLSPA